MPTALILNGRVMWSGPVRVIRTAVPHNPRTPADELAARETTAQIPALFRTAGTVKDEHDGLNYRVIEKIDPQQGWVSCEAVMRWFGVDHKAVVEWAQRGLLDCATEKGSEVRYYRVLNPEALRNAMPKQEKRQGGRRRFKP